MTRVFLRVSRALHANHNFRLPDGYRVVGKSTNTAEETVVLEVEGEFPAEDGGDWEGDPVTATVSKNDGEQPTWQWLDEYGEPIGDPITMYGFALDA